MPYRKKIAGLSFELGKIIKHKVKELQEKKVRNIQIIENETKKEYRKARKFLDKNVLLKSEFDINMSEYQKIEQIKNDLNTRKLEYIEKFIKEIKKEIILKKHESLDSYFHYLNKNIEEYSQIVDSPAEIMFSKEDLDMIYQNNSLIKINNENIIISKNTIECRAGFKIQSNDGKYSIDFTLENKINQNKEEISLHFMKIFPVFEVNIENAIDVYKKIHCGDRNLEEDVK